MDNAYQTGLSAKIPSPHDVSAAHHADGMRIDSRYAGRTVLGFGAHPDDLELGVGGTLARLSGTSRVVMAVVCAPNELETRMNEAHRAAAILGCELRFLVNNRCCRVEDLKTYELVEMFDELVKELQPALVLSHGASDFHKDHILVYNAALAAQRLRAFDHFCFHPTSTRPVPVPFNPQAYVDISATVELKMDAIAAHVSQFAARGLPIEAFRAESREAGRMVGLGFAEGLEIGRLMLA